MRSTRNLLRRRLHLVRKHAELLGDIQNTRHQHNTPVFEKRIDLACNRGDLWKRFDHRMVAASIAVDSQLLDGLKRQIHSIELQVTRQACVHDPTSIPLLRTIPDVGITLALTILYEIGDIASPVWVTSSPTHGWSSVSTNPSASALAAETAKSGMPT